LSFVEIHATKVKELKLLLSMQKKSFNFLILFQQCTATAYINLFDLIRYLTMQLHMLQVLCVLLTALYVCNAIKALEGLESCYAHGNFPFSPGNVFIIFTASSSHNKLSFTFFAII
jgi:hypothetical protein